MATKITATVKDSQDKRSSISFFLDDSVTDPAPSAQAILEDIDLLIDGVIENVSFTRTIDRSGWTLKSAQTADNNRSDGGRFIFTSPEGLDATVTLPTFDKTTYVPSGSELIDTANVDVAAFLASFLGSQTVTISGIEVTSLKTAYETFGGQKN